MRSFHTVSQVAREFEVSGQTVRDWIEAGHLLAIQTTPGGRYKVPAQALLVFKQNAGLLPAEELSFPRGGESREFDSSEEIYAELIAPRLKAAGVSSLSELLSLVKEEPQLAALARDILPTYDLYLKELAAEPLMATSY